MNVCSICDVCMYMCVLVTYESIVYVLVVYVCIVYCSTCDICLCIKYG